MSIFRRLGGSFVAVVIGVSAFAEAPPPVKLPDRAEGNVNGLQGITFWPIDEQERPADPAGCTVYLVPSDVNQRLSYPCGTWIAPPSVPVGTDTTGTHQRNGDYCPRDNEPHPVRRCTLIKVVRAIPGSLIVAGTLNASIPAERDNHCPPDPDTGWLHCNARLPTRECLRRRNGPAGRRVLLGSKAHDRSDRLLLQR